MATLLNDVMVCYDVHGHPGQIMNLLTSPTVLINSLFIKAPSSVDGTYHGAIGIVVTSLEVINEYFVGCLLYICVYTYVGVQA